MGYLASWLRSAMPTALHVPLNKRGLLTEAALLFSHGADADDGRTSRVGTPRAQLKIRAEDARRARDVMLADGASYSTIEATVPCYRDTSIAAPAFWRTARRAARYRGQPPTVLTAMEARVLVSAAAPMVTHWVCESWDVC